MRGRSLEIICTECGADALLRREPDYEGFRKVGELFFCSACGHQFAEEEDVPFKRRDGISVFNDSDKSKHVDVFHNDVKGRNCRHCENYVVNPFIQRCSIHHKEVQATDVCDDFKENKNAEQDEN